MTLKELKEKLDKLSKAYNDKTEVVVFTKEDDKGCVFHTPNAIEVRTAIDEKGTLIEKIFIVRK